LAKGSTVSTLLNKSTLAALVLVAASVLGIGVGTLNRTAAGQKTDQAPPQKAATPAAPEQKVGTVSGRVLTPDGKPAVGAELLLLGGENKGKPEKLGAAGPDGRFSVTAPWGKRWVVLLARSAGVGIDFIDLGKGGAPDKVELRLVKDNPIRGRVLD